jgi:hypothetical protein
MHTEKATLEMVAAWNQMTGKGYRRVGARIKTGLYRGCMFYLLSKARTAVLELPKERAVTVQFIPQGESCTIIDSETALRKYSFDCVLTCTIPVEAISKEAAVKALRDKLDCASANLGAWDNGDPILAEVSLDVQMCHSVHERAPNKRSDRATRRRDRT